VLVNGLLILGFALGGVVLGERFWQLLGVASGSSPLVRLLAWYLGVHGLAAVLASRAPEKQPAVLVAVGAEKIGAVACFVALALEKFSLPLVLLAGFDAVMAVSFLLYARHVRRAEP
jgi:hypothetical protein